MVARQADQEQGPAVEAGGLGVDQDGRLGRGAPKQVEVSGQGDITPERGRALEGAEVGAREAGGIGVEVVEAPLADEDLAVRGTGDRSLGEALGEA